MHIQGRLLLWTLVAVGVTACRGAAPPLPPVPASSGPIMLKTGEAPPLREGATVVDRVVAVVNGDVIAMSELDEFVAVSRREARSDSPLSEKELDELQRSVLERMVNTRLQVQEARKEKIEITDDDLRGVVDDFVKRNGGDREKLEVELRGQGLTWDAIRREFRDQLLAQRIRSRRVGRRVTVTEAEVDAYMAENRGKLEAGLKYHARHIAVLAEPPESPAAWERAKAEVDEMAALLRAGGDFAALARERSRDASAPTGGDLGWLARGELEPLFETPLLKMPKGSVSAPIKSSVGYHLFRLEDRQDVTAEMLVAARQQAREILLQKKAQERLEEWVEGLRRRALITIRL